MSKIITSIATVLVITLASYGATLPTNIMVSKNGSFEIDGIKFTIQGNADNWKDNLNNRSFKEIVGKCNSEGLAIQGNARFASQWVKVEESLTPIDANRFKFNFQLKFPEVATVNSLYGEFMLPSEVATVVIDGKPFQLPRTFEKIFIYNNPKAKSLTFTTPSGVQVTVDGDPLPVFIQDNRSKGGNLFAMRLGANPKSGEMSESTLVLDFKIEPTKIEKVDLTNVVNVGFSDEVANDGKGGWTDQGSDNDLRMIQPGTVKVGTLEFDVIDPAKNKGKSALVLSGTAHRFSDASATVNLPENNAQAINLLHASAFNPSAGQPIGTIIAQYADGTSEKIPVIYGTDCCNWWGGTLRPNAVIAWEGENPQTHVCLYASSFALKKPSPTALRFETATPNVSWMIVGVSLSKNHISLQDIVYNDPEEIKESLLWKPLDFNRTVSKGSPLDFSSYLDGPAGKYGFIQARSDGSFGFEKDPQKSIRLYGGNLAHYACFMPQADVDKLADYLAYCGYNSMRLHHVDGKLIEPDEPMNSTTIDPDKLDRLDYLLFKLKEKGIYVTADLHTGRRPNQGDHIQGIDVKTIQKSSVYKALLPINSSVMENWKLFVRNWMTHLNPYTGLTWAEDPTLYCVNLGNEDNLLVHWDKSPVTLRLYEKAFKEYCSKQNLPFTTPGNSNIAFRKFIQEIDEKRIEEQIRFVKAELKMKTLVTDLNFVNDIPLTLTHERLDVVDKHCYFDHPHLTKGAWRTPVIYMQTSNVKSMAITPRNMMFCRIPGKSFIMTEINHCDPNVFRSEYGPVVGSYAALQGWNALYRYAWSNKARYFYEIKAPDGVCEHAFDTVNDPLAQFSDRILLAMFVRGDVETAHETFSYAVPEDCFEQKLYGTPPSDFGILGLITGIGSHRQGRSDLPKSTIEVKPDNCNDPDKLENPKIATLWKQAIKDKIAVSATGQIRLDANTGNFAVQSPRTASVTLSTGNLSAGALQVQDASCFQTVAAISLDGKKLEESNSVLIFQLTNIANTGMQFNNRRRLLTKIGTFPMLIQKGTATVGLSSTKPYVVTALNCDGKPVGKVDGTLAKGVYSFKADTTSFPGGVMVYHLTR